MSRRFHRLRHGFTLVELMMALATLPILTSVVVVAVNPSRDLGLAYNAQRWMDINAIEKATQQYAIDHGGHYPPNIPKVASEICRSGKPCTGLVDLSVLTSHKIYLSMMPADPAATNENGTGYTIYRDADDRITVTAPLAQEDEEIFVAL